MAKLSGFYPPINKAYHVKRNPKKNCYEIVYYTKKTTLHILRKGAPNTYQYELEQHLHRSGISTRRDAENQCVALNARFGVVYV